MNTLTKMKLFIASVKYAKKAKLKIIKALSKVSTKTY